VELERWGRVVDRVGPPCWLSHTTAAELWGMDLYDVDPATHVTVGRARSRVRVPGLSVHRSDVPASHRELIGGPPVTSPVRTVADLARTCSHEAAVVAADSALRSGALAADELAELTGAMGRGSGRIRAVVHASDRSESVLETLARLLFRGHGLDPEVQREIQCQHRRYRADFVIYDLVVEVDGFGYHSSREVYAADRVREHDLMRAGYRVVRFTWDDIVHRPERTVATIRNLMDRRREA
jgi:very-short-patch-repair endonuclease